MSSTRKPRTRTASSEFATVFPVTVATLPGVTARPTIADEATAARLVASRAFSYEAPEGDAAGTEVTAFDETERPALDMWVSPVAHGDHYKSPKPEAAPAAPGPVDEVVDDQPADGVDAPATQ